MVSEVACSLSSWVASEFRNPCSYLQLRMGGVTARFKTWLRDLYRRLMLREAEIEESREGVGKDAFLSGLSDSWYFHGGLRRPIKRRGD